MKKSKIVLRREIKELNQKVGKNIQVYGLSDDQLVRIITMLENDLKKIEEGRKEQNAIDCCYGYAHSDGKWWCGDLDNYVTEKDCQDCDTFEKEEN